MNALPEPTSALHGRTVVTSAALHRLAARLVADTAGVRPAQVSVRLSDDRGALRATVSLPVVLTARASTPLSRQGEGIRDALIGGMDRLAGRRVAVVDVRYAGVQRERRRVI
ncbi:MULTISPECIES: hypothetical protein [Bacteria]|uniref:hypothetical protein n=1 Tax=Bacteria TaxID=2 RepID=UPI003C7E6BB4